MADRRDSEPDRYEFDAPSHVDTLENIHTDDTWFDQQATAGHLITPMRNERPSDCMVEEPIAVIEESPAAVRAPPVNVVAPTIVTAPPSNIVTGWGPGVSTAQKGARPKTRSSGQPPAQPRRVSKRKGAACSSPSRPAGKKTKSSEDEEMDRIRNLQKEVALQRKRNEANYKAALAGKPLQKVAISSAAQEEEASSCVKVNKSVSKGNKREATGAATYVPLAQAVRQFESRTPERFHLPSRQNLDKGPRSLRGDHLKLTQPHSPNLMTRQRSRAATTTVKSTDEMEAEEMAKLQKNKFKAQPLPKKIMETVVGVPQKKVLQPTVPESPAFALKNRVRVEKVEEVKAPPPVKAAPVPHFGLPFQPRLPEKHQVEVCPFSFEEREREKRVLKEKNMEENHEAVPEFKAQLLPHFDTVVLPEKKKTEPTKPKPFRLLTDERGSTKSIQQEHMLREEQKLQEESATFRARPNTVVYKEPFQPKKENRSAVAVESFELATQRRAREREESRHLASEQEAHKALLEEQQRREEEQQVAAEIARLRQEQVHKAQPIRHYKPVPLKKSETPLTVPKSPNFSDRFQL